MNFKTERVDIKLQLKNKTLFYRDNLLLYAKSDEDFVGLRSTVKYFSDYVGVQFSLNKYVKITFKKDLRIKCKTIILYINKEDLEFEHYETHDINYTINKEQI